VTLVRFDEVYTTVYFKTNTRSVAHIHPLW